MSSTKKRVHFQDSTNDHLDVKPSKDEVTADSESESDEIVFGVVKNLYVPNEDGGFGMFRKDENKKKKKSIRGAIVGMANLFLTNQILNARKLIKNEQEVNDRKFSKSGSPQRRGKDSKTGTTLLNADAWRNTNPMINLDLCRNAFASSQKGQTRNVRKASAKTQTELFTTPSRKEMSLPRKYNKDFSEHSSGSTTSMSTASLSPQSSITSRGTVRFAGDRDRNIMPITPTQGNLNVSNHGYNLSMSSSDDEDDYSVDEELEEIASVTSNQYLPNRALRSSFGDCRAEFSVNKIKRRSVTTKTPSKYMMYQINNDQSPTKGIKHKSN
jgi:hypothetical protein